LDEYTNKINCNPRCSFILIISRNGGRMLLPISSVAWIPELGGKC